MKPPCCALAPVLHYLVVGFASNSVCVQIGVFLVMELTPLPELTFPYRWYTIDIGRAAGTVGGECRKGGVRLAVILRTRHSSMNRPNAALTLL